MYRKERPNHLLRFFAVSAGTIFGLAHLGMIGLLVDKKSDLPIIDLPTTPFSSYTAEVNRHGYRISYRSHDPKTVVGVRNIIKPAGFLGLRKSKANIYEERVVEGQIIGEEAKLTEKEIQCLKREGAGEATGGLVGASVGAKLSPSVANIPVIGFVLSGFVNMFSQKEGAKIGGQMARDFSDC